MRRTEQARLKTWRLKVFMPRGRTIGQRGSNTAPESDPSYSPILTAAAKQMGLATGTAAHISPEPTRGRPVDEQVT